MTLAAARVIWTEGLFLRPQHFQQQDRHHDWLLHTRLQALLPFGWGFQRLQLDAAALRLGKLALAEARGVLADGSPFDLPSAMAPLAPLEVPADTRDRMVYLQAQLARPDAKEAALDAQTAAERRTRWQAQPVSVADAVAGFDDEAELQLGRLRLALVMDDALDGAACALPLARIVERRPSGEVVLDAGYIPPLLDATAQPRVRDWLAELHGVVVQRAQMLAGRLGESQSKGPADLLLLQVCNRLAPLLEQWSSGCPLHPQALYLELLRAAGDCASFDLTLGRRAPSFVAYRHDALAEVLLPPIELIRRTMVSVAELTAVQIPVRDRGRGLHSAEIPDPRMFGSGHFVLGAAARIDEQRLAEALPGLLRICAPDRLFALTEALSNGIRIAPLPGTPVEIRWHAHFRYFQLDPGSEHWKDVQVNRQLALLVLGELPGIELELWFIRAA